MLRSHRQTLRWLALAGLFATMQSMIVFPLALIVGFPLAALAADAPSEPVHRYSPRRYPFGIPLRIPAKPVAGIAAPPSLYPAAAPADQPAAAPPVQPASEAPVAEQPAPTPVQQAAASAGQAKAANVPAAASRPASIAVNSPAAPPAAAAPAPTVAPTEITVAPQATPIATVRKEVPKVTPTVVAAADVPPEPAPSLAKEDVAPKTIVLSPPAPAASVVPVAPAPRGPSEEDPDAIFAPPTLSSRLRADEAGVFRISDRQSVAPAQAMEQTVQQTAMSTSGGSCAPGSQSAPCQAPTLVLTGNPVIDWCKVHRFEKQMCNDCDSCEGHKWHGAGRWFSRGDCNECDACEGGHCHRHRLFGRHGNGCDDCDGCNDCHHGHCCFGPRIPCCHSYSMTYGLNPWYHDARDSNVYAAQGWGVPMAVPMAPNVTHQYNYGWGIPSSRITPISRVTPNANTIPGATPPVHP